MSENSPLQSRDLASMKLDKSYPISYRVVLKQTFPWIVGFLVFSSLLFMAYLNLNSFVSDAKTLGYFHYALIGALEVSAVCLLCKLAYEILHRVTYHYSIQGKQLVISKGIILRSRGAFPLARITDVYLDRDFGDLILNLYSLHLSTPTIYSGQFARIDGLSRSVATSLQSYLSILLEGSQMAENGFGGPQHEELVVGAGSSIKKQRRRRTEMAELKVFVQ